MKNIIKCVTHFVTCDEGLRVLEKKNLKRKEFRNVHNMPSHFVRRHSQDFRVFFAFRGFYNCLFNIECFSFFLEKQFLKLLFFRIWF